MKRRFYLNIQTSKRLLSLEEIANACSISSEKIHSWIATGLIKPDSSTKHLIDAVEIMTFLTENSLPVPNALLPPQTKKILFIAGNMKEFSEHSLTIKQVCDSFSGRYNILSETVIIGRIADLTILSSQPDLVVLFLKSYNLVTANLLKLLDSRSVKTILLVERKTQADLSHGAFYLPGNLILYNKTPEDLLHNQVRTIFDA